MILSSLAVVIIFAFIVWTWCKLSSGKCKSSRHMVGKTVIVTGANSGIGFETAKNLAERGARVILACRDEGRGIAAREEIMATTGNLDVEYRQLDLASLQSIRQFADNFLKTEKRLDVLINNAACLASMSEITNDGLPLKMQTNHFGPFLLTNLLLPILKSSAPSRIVNVSSMAHIFGMIDVENLTAEKKGVILHEFRSYSNTKLCNILMTVELDRQLKGTGVTVNALHPGIIASTGLGRDDWVTRMFLFWLKIFWKTPWEGAQTTIYLAASPELATTSGRYFSDCKEVKPMMQAQNTELARKLWIESEKLVKLHTYP